MASFCSEVVNPHANLGAYEMSKAGIIMLIKIIEDFTGRSWKGEGVSFLEGVNVGQESEAMNHPGNLEKKGGGKRVVGHQLIFVHKKFL